MAVYADNTDGVARGLNITNDTILGYQKNGTAFFGAGLTLSVTGNTVTGAGATPAIAQNGIEVGLGATGTIANNHVSGNEYSGTNPGNSGGPDQFNDVQSCGILLFSTSGLVVSGNTVDGNDIGIYNNTDGATISGNVLGSISPNRYEGVVEDQGSSTISGNTIGGGNLAIDVVSFDGNTAVSSAVVDGNTIAGATVGLEAIVQSSSASAVDVLAQNNGLAGNGEGVVISGGALVDLGEFAPNQGFTPLGTSVGNNTLTGYSGAPSNYAIDDQNASTQPNVYAQNNNFGPASSTNQSAIQAVIHDHGTNPAFSTVIFVPAQNAQPAPLNVYVNSAWAGLPFGTDPDGSGPATAIGYDAFASIQAGVNAVAPGGTVHIEHNGTATVYDESNILVDQPETITGDSQSGVIVAPAFADSHTDSSFGGTVSNGFVVASSNVTIEDLTIDGNANSSLSGAQNFRNAVITNSQNDNATYNDLTVDQLTVQHIYRKGIALYNLNGVSAGNSISNSTFNDIGTDGSIAYEGAFAVAAFQSDATISANTISGSGGGIGANSFDGAPGAPVLSVSDNTITAPVLNSPTNGALGMDLASLADGSTIWGNRIDTTGGNANDVGLIVSFVNGQVTVSGNTIGGTAGDDAILLYQDTLSSAPVLLQNNVLSGAGVGSTGTGILLTAQVGDTSRFGDLAGPVYATVSGNSIDGFGTGVGVVSDGISGDTVNATIGGSAAPDSNTLSNCNFGVLVSGAGADATITGNNTTFSGNGAAIAAQNFGSASSSNNIIEVNSFQWGVGRGISASSGGTVVSRRDSIDMDPAEFAQAIFVDDGNFQGANDLINGGGTASAPGNGVGLYVSANEQPKETVSLNFTKIQFVSKAVQDDDTNTGVVVDAFGNYWGTNTEVGVAGMIGGAAPDQVDYSPWLDSGTNTLPPGQVGFAGDFSTLDVGSGGAATAAIPQQLTYEGRITEALSLLQPPPSGTTGTPTINVFGADAAPGATGIYNEDVVIHKKVSLLAVGAADINGDGIADAIDVDNDANGNASGSVIQGFTINGDKKDAIKMNAADVTVAGNTLTNNGNSYAVEIDDAGSQDIITGNTFASTGAGNLSVVDGSNTIGGTAGSDQNTFTAPPAGGSPGFEQFIDNSGGLDSTDEIPSVVQNNLFNRGVTDSEENPKESLSFNFTKIVYANIQQAVNDANNPGGPLAMSGNPVTVSALAGVYTENLTLGTASSLTLQGPQAGNSGTSADRESSAPSVSEVVIQPTSGTAIKITGGDIVVDGLTVNDLDTTLPAVQLAGGTAGIQNDVILAGGTGVEVDPSAAAGWTVKSDFIFMKYDAASVGYGISVDGGVSGEIAGNDVEGNGIGAAGATGAGIYVKPDSTLPSKTVKIDGGNIVRDNPKGLLVSFGFADIENNNIYGNGTGAEMASADGGIVAHDDWESPAVAGAAPQTNGTDVQFDVGASGWTVGDGNTFDASTFYIVNDSAQTLDLTGDSNNTFGGYKPQLPTSPSDTTNLNGIYGIEDKTYDYLDDPAAGYVKYFPMDVFVAQSSENTNIDSIQRGINVSPSGGTLHVQAGTFDGSFTVDQSLTLLGAQAGNDPTSSTSDREGSTPSVSETVVRKLPGRTSFQPITLQAGIVKLDGFWAWGEGVSSGETAIEVQGGASATIVNTVIEDAATGIQIDPGTSSANVSSDYLFEDAANDNQGTGIKFQGTAGAITTGDVNNDNILDFAIGIDVTGAGANASIQDSKNISDGAAKGQAVDGILFDSGGSGTVTRGSISGATTGIAVGDVNGDGVADITAVSFTGNTTGVQVGAGSAVIGGATSSDGNTFTSDGTAVWVSGGAASATVSNNSFSGNGTALQAQSGGTLNSQNNTIDINSFQFGVGRGISASSGGTVVSRRDSIDMDPAEFAQAIFVDGGSFQGANDLINGGGTASAPGNGVGLYVSANEQPKETVSLNFTKIQFVSKAVQDDNTTPGVIVDASGNYWGTNTEQGIANTIGGAGAAEIDYTPWLDNGTNLATTGGFDGDFSTLDVGSGGAEVQSGGRINEAVGLLTPGGTIQVFPGNYREDVSITKGLTLESVGGVTVADINGDGLADAVAVAPGVAGVTIGAPGRGFTINGGSDVAVGLNGTGELLADNVVESGGGSAAVVLAGTQEHVTANVVVSSGSAWAVSIPGGAEFVTDNVFQSTGPGNVSVADGTNTLSGNTFTAPPIALESGFEQYRDTSPGLDSGGEITAVLDNNAFNRGADDYTDSGTTLNFKKIIWADIHPAMAAASAGDTIGTLGGVYAENVTVTKNLTLVTSIAGSGQTIVNGAITIQGGITLVLQSPAATPLQISSLAFGPSGVLDLARSTLLINYAGQSDPLAAIRGYLANGYNHGAWNGSNANGVITSSAAQSNPNHNTAIGYADSADGTGVITTPNTIELKYTLYGDANLDAQVNSADLQIMLANLNRAGGWDQGDFNYDGNVNSADLQALLATLNTSLGNQPAPAIAAAGAAAATPLAGAGSAGTKTSSRQYPVVHATGSTRPVVHHPQLKGTRKRR
ncbi:MAG TPA: hypothetical protein VK797_01400 [Tepidisphaeraceae bacterium]|nr:hypothetical protein [Tepidisphaeraceae bacterium]